MRPRDHNPSTRSDPHPDRWLRAVLAADAHASTVSAARSAVLARIGDRTPRQFAALQRTRFIMISNLAAALLLTGLCVSLLLPNHRTGTTTRDEAQARIPALILLEENGFETQPGTAAVLAEMFTGEFEQ